ncbi:hypothetical protein CGRA01v4_11545 [Colletotrichum graminicola]|nr:hypothetical protein CGRA01v4_11545 [Colletotrichum graminicola]
MMNRSALREPRDSMLELACRAGGCSSWPAGAVVDWRMEWQPQEKCGRWKRKHVEHHSIRTAGLQSRSEGGTHGGEPDSCESGGH